MKHQAQQLATALGRVLDLVSSQDTDAVAIDACRSEWLVAEAKLAEVAEGKTDAGDAREELERCASLRRLLRSKTGEELGRIDGQLDKVRAHARRLPDMQPTSSGGSCDMRA